MSCGQGIPSRSGLRLWSRQGVRKPTAHRARIRRLANLAWWGLSLCQKYAEHIGGGSNGALSEALFVKAAERVGQHYEGVVGDAADVRHSLAAGNERLGADDCCGDAALFKGDAVVHTAR